MNSIVFGSVIWGHRGQTLKILLRRVFHETNDTTAVRLDAGKYLIGCKGFLKLLTISEVQNTEPFIGVASRGRMRIVLNQ